MLDVFEQLKLTWVFGVLFAAPFWIGMYWRRATKAAAWCSVAFCALAFFILPMTLPKLIPGLAAKPQFAIANEMVRTTSTREAAPSDVRAAAQAHEVWQASLAAAEAKGDEAAVEQLQGEEPQLLQAGDELEVVKVLGGSPIFWPDGLAPLDENGEIMRDADKKIKKLKPVPVGEPVTVDGVTTQKLAMPEGVTFVGVGSFQLDFLLYQAVGLDLQAMSDATLQTLTLPVKIVSPFLVMILVSLVTPRNSDEGLDRYYAKMKTPVDPDPEEDAKLLKKMLADKELLESKKLFPGSSLEFQRPSVVDVGGFIASVAICFAIIYLAVLLAGIGA